MLIKKEWLEKGQEGILVFAHGKERTGNKETFTFVFTQWFQTLANKSFYSMEPDGWVNNVTSREGFKSNMIIASKGFFGGNSTSKSPREGKRIQLKFQKADALFENVEGKATNFFLSWSPFEPLVRGRKSEREVLSVITSPFSPKVHSDIYGIGKCDLLVQLLTSVKKNAFDSIHRIIIYKKADPFTSWSRWPKHNMSTSVLTWMG